MRFPLEGSLIKRSVHNSSSVQHLILLLYNPGPGSDGCFVIGTSEV